MRYLRHSIYDPCDLQTPITAVIPEESLKDDIWTAATNLRALAVRMGLDVDAEIFEFDGGFEAASVEGARRAMPRMDRIHSHRLTLYDWLISLFKTGRLADKALISTTKPCPLEKKDLFEVIMEAVKHPEYRGFVISIHDRNYEAVSVCVDKAGTKEQEQ